jgi:hypothetical protein
LSLNAIRSNPNVIGHSMTGTVDQGMTAEGLWTTFRELKPGTADALFDGWAPLRLCLFAEPVHVYRGATVHLEAVLANEDALRPGEYPVRLQVFSGEGSAILDRKVTLSIPPPDATSQPPFALPVFAEDVPIDGPAGKYRFVAGFEQGAVAAGGEAEFYVADPAALPAVEAEIVLWGEDPVVKQWLVQRGIPHREFSAEPPTAREVIVAGVQPPAPGGAAAFKELATRIARGATAIFLAPEVFADGDRPTAWVPLANKGRLAGLPSWLYHKDEWAKPHPIFDGLPTGLMDYAYYRELIPDRVWADQELPAEAVSGANDASIAYSSGLLLSVHKLGAGQFALTTLRIRENLGTQPAADRLLLNLLRYAGRDRQAPLADLPADFAERLNGLF